MLMTSSAIPAADERGHGQRSVVGVKRKEAASSPFARCEEAAALLNRPRATDVEPVERMRSGHPTLPVTERSRDWGPTLKNPEPFLIVGGARGAIVFPAGSEGHRSLPNIRVVCRCLRACLPSFLPGLSISGHQYYVRSR